MAYGFFFNVIRLGLPKRFLPLIVHGVGYMSAIKQRVFGGFMPVSTQRFTKAFLAKLPFSSNKNPMICADTVVRGLKFKVGMSRKTFLLEKRIRGRQGSAITIKLGTFPNLSLEEARKIGRRYISLCERGFDPRVVDLPGDLKPVAVTLAEAVEKFFELKGHQLAAQTIRDYRGIIRNHLNDWLAKDLCTTTQDDIAAKYMKIASKSLKQAVTTIRVLSSIWNTVTFHFVGEDRKRLLPTNPIPEAIRMMGGFGRMKPKRTVIPLHKLGEWVHTLERLRLEPETTHGKKKTYESLLLSLFLGLRNQEARLLRWDGVDLEMGVVTVEANTAKNRRKHVIPIPEYVWTLLKELAAGRDSVNPYVFPSKRAAPGPNPFRPIHRQWQVWKEISQGLGIEFSPHATRRTFASVANHLKIPFLTLKRLMNHHFEGGVTGGYIIPDFNPSENREEVEKIADFIVAQRDAYRKARLKPTG